MSDLHKEAANPATPPTRLQDLATNQPALRPIIALNPSAYPALVDWLGSLGDPAVTAALNQRAATQKASSEGGLTRVSVRDRAGVSNSEPTGPITGATQKVEPPPAPDAPQPTQPQPTHPQPAAQPRPASPPIPDPQAQVARPLPPNYQVQPTVRAEVPSNSKRNLIVALIALFMLAAAGAVAVWFLLRPAEPVAPPTATTTETTEETAEVTVEEEEEAEAGAEEQEEELPAEPEVEPLYPAPPSSFTFNHFTAPSGNIVCQFTETSVTCTIKSHDYDGGGYRTCGPGALSLTLTEAGAELDCAHPPVSAGGSPTLSYGDYTAFGDNACQSEDRGITCWNIYSGESFALARQGYGFETYPMMPSDFPWLR